MKGLCQFSCDLNKDLGDWVGNVLCRCSFIMSAFGLCFQDVSRIRPPLPISTTSSLASSPGTSCLGYCSCL